MQLATARIFSSEVHSLSQLQVLLGDPPGLGGLGPRRVQTGVPQRATRHQVEQDPERHADPGRGKAQVPVDLLAQVAAEQRSEQRSE